MTPVVRLLLVLGLAVVAGVVVLIVRRRPLVRARVIDAADLAPGMYLLTSADCASCARARERLDAAGVAYTELVWQGEAAVFARLGVDAVPSTVIVDDGGRGRWWRGGVPRQIPRSGTDLG